MDILRSIRYEALASRIFFAKECLVFLLFFALATLVAPLSSKLITAHHLSTIDPDFMKAQRFLALKESERVNLKEMVANARNYSYQETQLGFYLKNLEFFDAHSKQEAEKKILESLPKSLARKAKRYLRAVLIMSEYHQVDPIWILSVMWTESNFDYSAKSWAGARGLMQIMPDTRKFVYNIYNSGGYTLLTEQPDFNIDEYFPHKIKKSYRKAYTKKLVNIELGVIYLGMLLDSFKSHKYATVAYNMGPGWTRGRLKRREPVGVKNLYLDKVRKAYLSISKKI